MILFHGSNTENIKILEPRQADHDRPYIYLTTLEIVAGFYLINAVERPYYWFPYGFGRNGIEYHELFPNALKEAAQGRKGYIYTVNAEEKDVLPFKNIPYARLGTAPMRTESCREISDCYKWLLEQEAAGVFHICRYQDKSSQEMERWYQQIYDYIKEKKMLDTPECSYAEFVRKKFPKIWERLENSEKQQ